MHNGAKRKSILDLTKKMDRLGRVQEDLSSRREEVYRVMGCSIYTSKAIIFFTKIANFVISSSGKVG